MRGFLLAAVVAVSFAGAGRAQEALERNGAIEGTIQSQIEAFLNDDFATAFDFASPSIQSLFGTPESFGTMVRRAYPMVWRPADVRYGELREIGGALWQKVIVRDEAGAVHVLDYRMIRQDGAWRISGVQILLAPDVAA